MRRCLIAIACFMVSALSAQAQTAAFAPGLKIDKQAARVVHRNFDPARPPADMPPLSPPEVARCEYVFSFQGSAGLQVQPIDATHAVVTVTGVTVNLQLNVTIWLPNGATQVLIAHEEGHHQIAEAFYRNADRTAARIAGASVSKQFEITGADLPGEAKKALQKMADQMNAEYLEEIAPQLAEERYDAITDHGRNGVAVSAAMAQALAEFPPK